MTPIELGGFCLNGAADEDEDGGDDKDLVHGRAAQAWGFHLMTSVMSCLTQGGLPYNYQAGIKSQTYKENT